MGGKGWGFVFHAELAFWLLKGWGVLFHAEEFVVRRSFDCLYEEAISSHKAHPYQQQHTAN